MTFNEKFSFKRKQTLLTQVENEISVWSGGINTTDDEYNKQQSDIKLQPFLIENTSDKPIAKDKCTNCLDMFFNNKKNE